MSIAADSPMNSTELCLNKDCRCYQSTKERLLQECGLDPLRRDQYCLVQFDFCELHHGLVAAGQHYDYQALVRIAAKVCGLCECCFPVDSIRLSQCSISDGEVIQSPVPLDLQSQFAEGLCFAVKLFDKDGAEISDVVCEEDGPAAASASSRFEGVGSHLEESVPA